MKQEQDRNTNITLNESADLSKVNLTIKPVAIQVDGITTVRNGDIRFSYGQTEATEISTEKAGPNYNASLSGNVAYSVSGNNSVSSLTFKRDGVTFICSTSEPE